MKIKPFPLILILLLVAFTSSYAQSYKMIYDFQWKSNKKSPEHNSELCALITRENNQPSFFESYENFRLDSLKTKVINDYAKNNRQGPLRLPSDEKKSLFRPLIIKNPADKTITVEEKAYVKLFSVTYSCPIKWKIQSNDKETILGYKAQKAVCEFGGRNWTAWFTNEIPIMDGPYKFSGLPGLILKIQDSEKNYSFEIKSITKESNDIEHRNFGSSKAANLSPKQWEKFWDSYRKQPSMVLENLNTEKTTYVINGKDVNSREVKDAFNKKEWDAMKFFEDPIELTATCN
ncbi:GLPGLI family protein [Chryseobacterium daecheongense]|uniref:GLPGLI family protein n=2 Tax=Chryseobacterium daecheongense TaxID=192389 RepID=A0A3N0VU11_9FLAO|nr:GLPGLI family protein [Chryseobacterium daecheongense]TDX89856.1 GLPGLI family protein [Chryseobacterium daecheongense]